MHARVNTGRLVADADIPGYRDAARTAMGRVARSPGHQGNLVLVDADSRSVMAVSFWADEDAMLASEQAAQEVRDDASMDPVQERTVQRFEVALLDLAEATSA